MKTLALLFLTITYSISSWAVDCSQATITVNDQQDVDDFQSNFGPCDTVTGNLNIQDSNGSLITDLSGLSAITTVGGLLNILNNDALTSLAGLSGITTVAGLEIDENDLLQDLTGLENLTQMNPLGRITISQNNALINLTGLSGITTAGRLDVNGNDLLQDLTGLENLTQIHSIGSIEILNNDLLENLTGLSGIAGDMRRLTITDNPNLISLSGLGSLNKINDRLSIRGNLVLNNIDALLSLTSVASSISIRDTQLTNIDALANITDFMGNIILRDNPILLNANGLSSFSGIVKDIFIENNPQLSHLDSFATITGSVEDVIIRNNVLLANVDGLSALKSIGLTLNISDNAILANLNGLSSLVSVGEDVLVQNNAILVDCSGLVTLLDDFDDAQTGPGPGAAGIIDVANAVTLSGNTASCNSVAALLPAGNPVIYVDVDTIADNSCAIGQCWDHAYPNLQDALAAASSGDDIWLANGVYYPDIGAAQVDDDPASSFVLVNGVSLYGGFAGTETQFSQRDIPTNITVLSGDLQGNDTNTDGNFITELTSEIIGVNSIAVLNGENVDNTARVDGLTTTAGDSDANGGGMYCGNLVQGPSISHVTFIGNKAVSRGGAMYGCAHNIRQSSFINNQSAIAGAILSFGGNIKYSEFILNKATGTVAGAIRNSNGELSITNSKFIGNASTFSKAGAVWTASDIFIENSLFSGNNAGTNSGDNGGALFMQGSSNAQLINVTFTGNQAGGSGGAIGSSSSGNLNIQNSIIWNNKDSNGLGTAKASINHPSNNTFITHSIVQALGNVGVGNRDTDPLFVLDTDPATAPTSSGDARLGSGSPAVDVGDNSGLSETIDLDGSNRIQHSIIDLGAYESNMGFNVGLLSINVSGLAGTLVLQNNGADDLTFTQDGTQSFSQLLNNLTLNTVTILTQPSSPNQVCELSSSTTIIFDFDAMLSVTCTTVQHSIGVDVTGLSTGYSVVFLLNNSQLLNVTADGQFNFASSVDDGSAYAVSINSQPFSPNHECSLTSGNETGVINSADVSITVQCSVAQYFVDANAPIMGDGLSWATAFNTVQDALTLANNGTDIWVAAGVYYPDEGGTQIDNDKDATFTLIDGVSIYGGFDGTETELIQRDVSVNETILSGDIGGDDVNDDGNFIAENVSHISGGNSYTIVNGQNTGNNTLLDGFTITAANNKDGGSNNGGGIYCGNALDGPSINYVIFIGNRADSKGGAMYGCAHNVNHSSFINNSAGNITDGGVAGAIFSFGGTIKNSEFKSNSSAGVAGAIRNGANMLTIINTAFTGNSSGNGSGFVLKKGGAILTSTDLIIENSLFSGNRSKNSNTDYGGALFLKGSSNAQLLNVTMTGNKASGAGGAIGSTSSGTITLENTIIWNNQDINGIGGATASINHPSGTILINNSLVQGFDPAGTSNLDENPEFVLDTDPSTAPTTVGDARLTELSMAIDTGDNSVVNSAVDLDGNARIFNTTVDMGAYEFFEDDIFKDGFE